MTPLPVSSAAGGGAALARAARANARLLLARAFVSAAFYAAVPFAGVALQPILGLTTAGSVGLVALAALAGRLMSWPIGRVVDRIGGEPALRAAGAATFAAGAWSLAFPSAYSALFFVLALATVNPIANVALRVLVALRNAPEERATAYGLLGSAKTVGIAAGPFVVGVALAPDDWTSIVATACVALAVATLVTPPRRRGDAGAGAPADPAPVDVPARGGLPRGALALLAAKWALVWTALNAITVGTAPLFSLRYDDLRAAGIFFAVQSLLSAVLLAPAGLVANRLSLRTKALVFGIGTLGAPGAVLLLGLAPPDAALTAALLAAVLLAASEAITVPTLDTIVAETARAAPGGAFGRLATIEASGVAAGLGLASLLTVEHGSLDIGANWAIAGACLGAGLLGLVILLAARLSSAEPPEPSQAASADAQPLGRAAAPTGTGAP